MKNIFCLVSLIFIVSCSTPSDDQDVTNNTNNVGNINSGNNSNNGNTNNGSDSNDNNSNNNNSNDGSDSNNNNSSNQDEISSILFEKWGPSTNDISSLRDNCSRERKIIVDILHGSVAPAEIKIRGVFGRDLLFR